MRQQGGRSYGSSRSGGDVVTEGTRMGSEVVAGNGMMVDTAEAAVCLMLLWGLQIGAASLSMGQRERENFFWKIREVIARREIFPSAKPAHSVSFVQLCV